MNVYIMTVTPQNPGWNDAEVSMQEAIDEGWLVKLSPDIPKIAKRIAVEFLPDTGPCGVCGNIEIGARHRVADAIVDEVIAAIEKIPERCEHGNTGRHPVLDSRPPYELDFWCSGAGIGDKHE